MTGPSTTTAARFDVPALVAEVRRLRAVVAAVRESYKHVSACEVCAKPAEQCCSPYCSKGCGARADYRYVHVGLAALAAGSADPKDTPTRETCGDGQPWPGRICELPTGHKGKHDPSWPPTPEATTKRPDVDVPCGKCGHTAGMHAHNNGWEADSDCLEEGCPCGRWRPAAVTGHPTDEPPKPHQWTGSGGSGMGSWCIVCEKGFGTDELPSKGGPTACPGRPAGRLVPQPDSYPACRGCTEPCEGCPDRRREAEAVPQRGVDPFEKGDHGVPVADPPKED